MQGWARTISVVGCSSEQDTSCVVAVGVGCVPGEPSKSPLRMIVITLFGKVAKPNRMGRCRK